MLHVEICVEGHIDKQWSAWFDSLTIEHPSDDETVLSGPIVDQGALYGLLSRLRDLGLPLLSVTTAGQS